LLKRLTEFALSAIVLVVLSPLLALIPMAVKLTSEGPLLSAPERMGLDGRTFRMLKFRSMRVDALAVSGAIWAPQAAVGRTPIGTLLRRRSLDESPELS